MNDFAETAAAIDQLDLVIAVDTTEAHLAGALSKPLWLLISHSRIGGGISGAASAPGIRARLRDQPCTHSSDSVFERVGAELADFATGPGTVF